MSECRTRIAVVDDDRNLRNLLRLSLSDTEFEVREYEDGHSFLRQFTEDKPDVVLLDVWMPGDSGYSVCETIRTALNDMTTPVIIMTASDDFDSVNAAFRAGATDFFPKPTNTHLLYHRLRYVTRNAAMRAEREANQKKMMQAEKMMALGQLSAGVVHEINNPVGYIHSNAQIMTDYASAMSRYIEKVSDIAISGESAARRQAAVSQLKKNENIEAKMADVAEILSDIDEGVQRIIDVTAGMKVYAHPNEQEFVSTDLRSIVRSAEKMTVGELKKRVAIDVSVPEKPVWVVANPSSLIQVLVNLIINAADAIGHSRGRIEVSMSATESTAVVMVSDNGDGMSDELLGRIFDAFFTTKPVGVGSGLGLPVSKSIVERHRGELNVASQPGKGTTVTVSLPR